MGAGGVVAGGLVAGGIVYGVGLHFGWWELPTWLQPPAAPAAASQASAEGAPPARYGLRFTQEGQTNTDVGPSARYPGATERRARFSYVQSPPFVVEPEGAAAARRSFQAIESGRTSQENAVVLRRLFATPFG